MKPSLFLTLSFALVLSLTLNSCVKDNELTATKKTVEKPAALAVDDGESPPEQMTDGREGNNCDCYYIITSVNPGTPPPGYHFEYNLYATENCVGGLNCPYFSLKEGDCDYGLQEGCTDFIDVGAGTPNYLPFNCVVPGYSSFDVGLYLPLWLNDLCGPSATEPIGTIKLRIRCIDKAPLVCGLGYGYVSPEITVPINGTPPTIQLTDCGCKPIIQ